MTLVRYNLKADRAGNMLIYLDNKFCVFIVGVMILKKFLTLYLLLLPPLSVLVTAYYVYIQEKYQ